MKKKTEPEKKERHITIPFEPKTKKNSQRILINKVTGKPFIMPSKAAEKYTANVAYFLPRPRLYIDYPVNIKYHFYMKTRRKVDLTNLMECMDDALVRWGTLQDDNSRIIVGHDGSRVLLDPKNPRTEIWITPINESEEN